MASGSRLTQVANKTVNEKTATMVQLAQRRLRVQAERAETELRHGRVGVELIFQQGEVQAIKETTETTVK